MLVSVKSAVKGYHAYRNEFPKGTILECLQEPENKYSESAIIVKKGETVVGHMPEGLCQLFTKLFNDGRVLNISAEITGPPRPSSNGIFVKGGGIEVPCSYKLHGSSDKKVEVRLFLKKEIMKITA